ncbi:MAG: DUF4199 domain-containing protein [Bacteroidales bacterium]|nr:DUF4199 domain-containing protein [Bacteroidales bacterium]
MIFNPTYTGRQYWTTVVIAGLLTSVLLSLTYVVFYERLYVEYSYLFSIIYLIPFVAQSVTLAFFKNKFVWSEFSYGQAFLMSFITGIIGAIIFSGVIYILYAYLGMESRMELYENGKMMRELFSPVATAISMLIINVILSLFYSLIIAIFARKKD